MSSSSDTSRISANAMRNISDRLTMNRNRDSTKAKYHTIWKLFSQFILKLDDIPKT